MEAALKLALLARCLLTMHLLLHQAFRTKRLREGMECGAWKNFMADAAHALPSLQLMSETVCQEKHGVFTFVNFA